MQKLLILLLSLSSVVGFAQNAEFAAAATTFEEDNSAKALSILAQLEVKVGPNPKIESLRALSYNATGDNKTAYNSVLRYFKLAGRNNNAAGDADMISLEQTLKKGFENDLTKKKTELQNKRTEENEEVIDKINEATEIAFLKVKKTSEMHFNNLIANKDLTNEDINLIKANIKIDAVHERLISQTVGKINSILQQTKGLQFGYKTIDADNRGGDLNSLKYDAENKTFTYSSNSVLSYYREGEKCQSWHRTDYTNIVFKNLSDFKESGSSSNLAENSPIRYFLAKFSRQNVAERRGCDWDKANCKCDTMTNQTRTDSYINIMYPTNNPSDKQVLMDAFLKLKELEM